MKQDLFEHLGNIRGGFANSMRSGAFLVDAIESWTGSEVGQATQYYYAGSTRIAMEANYG